MRIFIFILVMSFSFSSFAEWYKGNTHTHTKLSGHGDTPPTQVAKWYHKRGYNFLVLSEHNRFIDPAKIKIRNQRKDFILIGGVEVSGPKHVHTTALNVKQVIPYRFDSPNKSEIVQYHTDQIHSHGGEAILNHPNWQYALGFDDIFPVENLRMFELYNGHPHVNNDGDHEHISTEQLWDKFLSAGKKIYGVSSDDAHWFKKRESAKSNPGRGWVMVEANFLNPDAITESMKEGRFYSSNGVILSHLNITNETYQIEVNLKETQKIIKKGYVVGKKVNANTSIGAKIDFISSDGVIVKTILNNKGEFNLKKSYQYIRAKISFTVKTALGKRQFFAWTQPVFPE